VASCAEGIKRRYGDFEIGCSCLSEGSYINPMSLKLVSLSKRSNFENRTESAESRAPERNEPFGENKPIRPMRSPELNSEIALVLG
jgi:hypothetical protein